MGGSGFQASLPGKAFEVLRNLFDIQFEVFASPMNTYYERFCSAFPDIDSPFGSVSSFFSFHPKSGSYEANPPFAPIIVKGAINHIENLLKNSNEPLSFAVVVPVWEDSDAWQLLRAR